MNHLNFSVELIGHENIILPINLKSKGSNIKMECNFPEKVKIFTSFPQYPIENPRIFATIAMVICIYINIVQEVLTNTRSKTNITKTCCVISNTFNQH